MEWTISINISKIIEKHFVLLLFVLFFIISYRRLGITELSVYLVIKNNKDNYLSVIFCE